MNRGGAAAESGRPQLTLFDQLTDVTVSFFSSSPKSKSKAQDQTKDENVSRRTIALTHSPQSLVTFDVHADQR